jgi:hypothetical protein
MPNIRIPALVKHMTIAIYREGKIHARSRKDRFKQCLEIAKSRCQQYGFVTYEGASLSEAVGLTPKGRAREAKHLSEGRAKTVLFDTLYDDFDIDGTKAAAEKAAREKEAAEVAERQEQNKAKYSKRDRL